MLTQVYLHKLFDYDPETGVFSWKPGTYAHSRKQHRKDRNAGTFNNKGYRMIKLLGHGYMLHRVIWLYVTGEWPKQLDHIDRDKTNNRFYNLREAETWQNCHNQSTRKNNTSGYKGVKQTSSGNWMASISVQGKSIYLGSFPSAVEASAVYEAAKIRYVGSSYLGDVR